MFGREFRVEKRENLPKKKLLICLIFVFLIRGGPGGIYKEFMTLPTWNGLMKAFPRLVWVDLGVLGKV